MFQGYHCESGCAIFYIMSQLKLHLQSLQINFLYISLHSQVLIIVLLQINGQKFKLLNYYQIVIIIYIFQKTLMFLVIFRKLEVSELPQFFLVYSGDPSDSGKIHSDVRYIYFYKRYILNIYLNTRNSRRFAPFFLALEGASRPSSKLIVNMFSLCTS